METFCSGLFLSARWFVVSQVVEKGIHLIVLPTREAAEYCSADLYNLVEGDCVFFLLDSGGVMTGVLIAVLILYLSSRKRLQA